MLTLKKIIRKPLIWLFILVLLLSACSNDTTPASVETPTLEIPKFTSTPNQPTPTSIPAAAVVNGERISLAWFENEVVRYILAQEAKGQPVEDVTSVRETVLNDIVDQTLLAQGAQNVGANLGDEDVQAQIDTLAAALDLAAWMADWGYTEEDLFQALKLQMLSAYQRDLIAESIPETIEQAEVRQVFAYTKAGANNAVASLNAGTPFEEVALKYDPDTGGYLGWVPRGYLLIPAVEEAAFNLPVGTYSEIIESDIGFHIVLVADREERPLTNDARLTLQRQAVHAWLADQRENSTIEVLIN